MNNELAERQAKLNKEYAEKGLTDAILDEQLEINRLRHEHDIPDETNTLHKEFVQWMTKKEKHS